MTNIQLQRITPGQKININNNPQVNISLSDKQNLSLAVEKENLAKYQPEPTDKSLFSEQDKSLFSEQEENPYNECSNNSSIKTLREDYIKLSRQSEVYKFVINYIRSRGYIKGEKLTLTEEDLRYVISLLSGVTVDDVKINIDEQFSTCSKIKNKVESIYINNAENKPINLKYNCPETMDFLINNLNINIKYVL